MPASESGFALRPRRSPVRFLRAGLRVLVVVAVVALLWAAAIGALWLYGASRLEAVPFAALRDDVLLLGAAGARAPADATTLLLVPVEELDPTVPRPPALAAPPALVQIVPGRDEPSVLILEPTLEVVVDGRGVMTLEAVQRELGADRLARAVIDYSEVRLDHVVVVSVELLPGLVRELGPLEVCGADGCSTPTPDDVRAWQRDEDPAEVLRRGADVVRALAGSIDVRGLVTSPLTARRAVDLLAGQLVTDVDLGPRDLLALLPGLAEVRRLDVDALPLVRNPTTGELVVLAESAMLRFSRLQDGLPLAGIDPAEDLERLRSVVDVAVLNGAGVVGLAALVEADLAAAGFEVAGTGNDVRFDRQETVISYRAGDVEAEPVAFLLVDLLPGARVEAVDRELALDGAPVSIVVVLGLDRVAADGAGVVGPGGADAGEDG
ncbi:MAG: LytR cell envelope-related transcriptional attenuator [Actinomycetota bacterium]